MQKHILSVLVNNHPGVMQRISGLFGRRGYNMESITVGSSERARLSRVIIVLRGTGEMLEQTVRQLNKLIDVVQVTQLSTRPMIAKELMLIKVRVSPQTRPELMSRVDSFQCSIVDAGMHSIVIQVVGEAEKNDLFLGLLEPYGILELTRTGETAMGRGDEAG